MATTINDRAGLDALPIGATIIDVHGFRLTKTGDVEWHDETNDEDNDTDEIMGAYAEGDTWLPATVVGGESDE